MDGRIDIEIAPKIAAFRANMAQIPGITEEAADKAAEAMRKQLWTKAAKEAAGLTNAIEREAEKQRIAIERESKAAARAQEKAAKDAARAQERAARDAARAQEKAAREAARAQERAAREATRAAELAAKEQTQGWVGVGKKVSELAGGPFSQLGQVVFELIPNAGKATTALGSVAVAGAAVAATAVGIAAVGIVVVKLANAAVDARDRLIEAGLAAEIPAEARASIDEYVGATVDLRNEWDLLIVSLGAGVSGPLADVVTVLSAGLEAFRYVRDETILVDAAWKNWVNSVENSHPVAAVAVAALNGLGVAAEYLRGATEDLTDSQLDYAQSQAELDDEAKRNARERADKIIAERKRTLEAEARDDIRRAEEYERNEKRKADAAIREAQRAADEQARIEQQRAQEHFAWLNEQQTAETEWRAEQAEIRLETEVANAELRVQLAEDEAQRKADAEKRWAEEAIAANHAAEMNAAAELQQTHEQQLANAKRDGLAVVKANLDNIGTILQAEIESQDLRTKEGRAAARRLLKMNKVVGIAGAIINTAEAVTKAFALYGPPPSPVGIGAAAAAVTSGGIQIREISKQKLPSFFHGGVVPGQRGEEVPIVAHGGEPVLPASVADQIGPEGVDQLVAGKALPAPTVYVTVMIDGKNIPSRTEVRSGMTSPFGRN